MVSSKAEKNEKEKFAKRIITFTEKCLFLIKEKLNYWFLNEKRTLRNLNDYEADRKLEEQRNLLKLSEEHLYKCKNSFEIQYLNEIIFDKKNDLKLSLIFE